MIHVDFKEPNFVCTLKDLDGNLGEEVHSAASEPALRAELQKRVTAGRLQEIVAIALYDFAKWKAKAAKETAKAIAAHTGGQGDSYEFKSSIWGELKSYLKQLFHGKCAYCEARFEHVAWGDVEHYRPKAKVTDETGAPIADSPGGPPHPGYYWLAYDPSNLMPSCQRCNQASAKMNKFPISGKRACHPADDLVAEKPLLLDPYHDQPRADLKFIPGAADSPVGTVAGLSAAGETSIRVYRLNREDLVDRRRAEQERALQQLKIAMSACNPRVWVDTCTECRSGEREFSTAVLAQIKAFLAPFVGPLGDLLGDT